MRIYIISFLVIVATLGVESASDEQGEEELYVYDDVGNLVKLEYNESDASVPWPSDLDREMLKDVKFYLYPRPGSEVQLFVDDTEILRKSGFNPNKKTVFVTHGWMNSKQSPACTLIRDALLKHPVANVIVVDWSKISKSITYILAARGVLGVGKYVAEMINFLQKNGMSTRDTYLVGHSLGAHVVGIAGYYSQEDVFYVTGLDPARPLFSSKKPGERISIEDALNVEIIHTNAGRLGLDTNLGKADFYPNGGRKQPNCGLDIGWACSHSRSYYYFAESVVTEVDFYGRKCPGSDIQSDKCNGEFGIMGTLKSNLREKGGYYVPTNGVPPYAQGKPS